MASGQTLGTFLPLANEPPASAFATQSLRFSRPCLEFSASSTQRAVFTGVMPSNYAGGGVTVNLKWAAATATSGVVRWDVAFERMAEAGDDADADNFASPQSASATTGASSGPFDYQDIPFTHSQQDSIVAGEVFRSIYRA